MYFDQNHAGAVDDDEADPEGKTSDEVCAKRLKKGFTNKFPLLGATFGCPLGSARRPSWALDLSCSHLYECEYEGLASALCRQPLPVQMYESSGHLACVLGHRGNLFEASARILLCSAMLCYAIVC